LPFLVITIYAPAAGDVAKELGQMLLGKQLVDAGFSLTAFDTHASLEFPVISNDPVEKIESEVQDWIARKHGALRSRKVSGKRQKQNLGMQTGVEEEVVCLEIRK
jgi:hypothetical protein